MDERLGTDRDTGRRDSYSDIALPTFEQKTDGGKKDGTKDI